VSALAYRIAGVLRDAGEDGLTLAEIEAQAGTRWALRVIRSMNRNGYVIGEQAGRYYLIAEPGVERATDTTTLPSVADEGTPPVASSSVGSSLSTGPLTLFPTASSPYDTELEAA
jgi:hypothetical protein